MKDLFKNPTVSNVVMAAVATATLAVIKKQFGIGDIILAFLIIMFILYFIDVFSRFTSFKMEKKAAKRMNRQQG